MCEPTNKNALRSNTEMRMEISMDWSTNKAQKDSASWREHKATC